MKKLLVVLIVFVFVAANAFAQINIGTSSLVANPQVIGDPTTGLYSSGAGKIDLSSGGANVGEFNASGLEANIDNSTALASNTTAALTVSDHTALQKDINQFGAVGDGVTDDTAAINAAGLQMSTLANGTANLAILTYGNAGQTYEVCGLTLYRNVILKNLGGRLQVKNGCSTSPPIASEGYATNKGSGKFCGHDASVPSWLGFQDLKLDANSSGASYVGEAVGIYGPAQIMAGKNIIYNAKNNPALLTQDSSSATASVQCQEEGMFDDIEIADSAGGWLMQGPHDSRLSTYIGARNATVSIKTDVGSGYAGTFDHVGHVHTYATVDGQGQIYTGKVTIDNAMSDGDNIVVNSSSKFHNMNNTNCGNQGLTCAIFNSDFASVENWNASESSNASFNTNTNMLELNGNNIRIGGATLNGTGYSRAYTVIRNNGINNRATVQLNGFSQTGSIGVDNENWQSTFDIISYNTDVSYKAGTGIKDNTVRLTAYLTAGQSAVSGTPDASNRMDIHTYSSTTSGVGYSSFLSGTASNPSIVWANDLGTGFWHPSSNTLAASTNGAEALRVISSGKIGIGTTAPLSTLSVAGNLALGAYGGGAGSAAAPSNSLAVSGQISIGTTVPDANEQIELYKSSANSNELGIILNSGTSNKEAIINFGSDNSSSNRFRGRIFYRLLDDSLRFWTNTATGNFMMDSAGNFGLNGSSFGGGTQTVFIANAGTVPTTNPSGGGILYTQGGTLKYRGSSGTITTLGNP